jgi:hypothetical protein
MPSEIIFIARACFIANRYSGIRPAVCFDSEYFTSEVHGCDMELPAGSWVDVIVRVPFFVGVPPVAGQRFVFSHGSEVVGEGIVSG